MRHHLVNFPFHYSFNHSFCLIIVYGMVLFNQIAGDTQNTEKITT